MKKIYLFAFLLLPLFSLTAQSWNETKKLVPADRAASDRFGNSVSVSDTFAIVGASLKNEENMSGNPISKAGAAYFFEKDRAGKWNPFQKVEAADQQNDDAFGFTVSIDGNTALVGAPKEDHDANGATKKANAGSAYFFERDSSGQWSQTQKVVASDREANDWFGYSVSLHGNFAILSAWFENQNPSGGAPINQAGSAYIFEKDSTGHWNEVQKIMASDRGTGDFFGKSVFIHDTYAIVGAYSSTQEDSLGNPLNKAGSAYIFERDSSGYWSETKKLLASDREFDDQFGTSVTVHGNFAAVGAFHEDENMAGTDSLLDPGSVYIFKRSENGEWRETQKLVASDRGTLANLGFSVSMHEDNLVAGAFFEYKDASGQNSMPGAGAAYIFTKDEHDQWNEVQKITHSDRAEQDLMGTSVAIYGNDVFVSASGEDENALGDSTLEGAGSVYVFQAFLTLGITKTKWKTTFHAYPNPTEGNLVIDLGETQAEVTVSVRNIMGQLISTQKVKQAKTINLDIKGTPGVYLVMVHAKNGKPGIVKVVKK